MMENILDTLVARGYPEKQAPGVAAKIEHISPNLEPAMSAWLKDGSTIEVEVKGYTPSSLMDRFRGMPYPSAVLLLDWLIREPETAEKAIKSGIR